MNLEPESIYEQYMSSLQKSLPKIDPNLAHQVMYLERKLASEYVKEPQVVLLVEYESGTNMDEKLYGLRETFSLEAENTENSNILLAQSRMKLDKVLQIANDNDVVKLTGDASPVIRS